MSTDILWVLIIIGMIGLVFNLWLAFGMLLMTKLHFVLVRTLLFLGIVVAAGVIASNWHSFNLPTNWYEQIIATFQWWYLVIVVLPGLLFDVGYAILTRPRSTPVDQQQ